MHGQDLARETVTQNEIWIVKMMHGLDLGKKTRARIACYKVHGLDQGKENFTEAEEWTFDHEVDETPNLTGLQNEIRKQFLAMNLT